MQSPAYNFLLNMWIMKRVDENYLNAMVSKGILIADEKNMIITTPQIL